MKPFLSLGISVLFVGALTAQSVVDTVGGTSSAPNRAAMAKANLFRVDKTVMLLMQEMYLNIPGAETLPLSASLTAWILQAGLEQDGQGQRNRCWMVFPRDYPDPVD